MRRHPQIIPQLQRLIDAQSLPEPSLESHQGRFGRFLAWGQPFCDLLDHPAVMPALKFLLGDGFRLDHYYGIYLREGTGPLPLHGGNTPYDPPEYYHVRNGQMYNGLTVVAWNLVAEPDEACVLWDVDARVGVEHPWGVPAAQVAAISAALAVR